MDKNFKNHLITLFAGVVLAVAFLYITWEIPESPVIRNHSSLTSNFLGLTLASSPEDIFDIIGGPENEEFMLYVEQFKSILFYQIILIVLYVIYFLQIIGFSYRNSDQSQVVYVLSVMVILGSLADIGENFQLQMILDATSSHRMDEPLLYMGYFSKAKWGFLFGTSALLGMKIWLSEKGLLLKTLSILLFTAFCFYIASFIRLNLIELGILFLILGFINFWIYSLLIIVLSKKT